MSRMSFPPVILPMAPVTQARQVPRLLSPQPLISPMVCFEPIRAIAQLATIAGASLALVGPLAPGVGLDVAVIIWPAQVSQEGEGGFKHWPILAVYRRGKARPAYTNRLDRARAIREDGRVSIGAVLPARAIFLNAPSLD